MAGGAASAAGSTANPRPFRLRRASSSDVTGQARQSAARMNHALPPWRRRERLFLSLALLATLDRFFTDASVRG